MWIKSAVLAILVFSAVSGDPQSNVSYCELVRNPELYDGKIVTVRATYSQGYEWSALFCVGSQEKDMIWLELPRDLNDASRKALKHAWYPGLVNLTVEGVFTSGGTYGHKGAYSFKLVATEINDVVEVNTDTEARVEKEKAAKQRACDCVNPK